MNRQLELEICKLKEITITFKHNIRKESLERRESVDRINKLSSDVSKLEVQFLKLKRIYKKKDYAVAEANELDKNFGYIIV